MQNPRQLLVIHSPLPLIPELIPQPPMCAQFFGGNYHLTELLMRTFMPLVKLDQPCIFMQFNQYICYLRQGLFALPSATTGPQVSATSNIFAQPNTTVATTVTLGCFYHINANESNSHSVSYNIFYFSCLPLI